MSVVVMVLVWVGGLVRSRTCLRGIVVNEGRRVIWLVDDKKEEDIDDVKENY